MNKQLVLVQFNKRSTANLTSKDLDVIVGMKGYSMEKIASAFCMLSGKDLGLKDLELLFLIIDLAEALTPAPVITPRINPFGPGQTGTPSWPYPGTITCDMTPADRIRAETALAVFSR